MGGPGLACLMVFAAQLAFWFLVVPLALLGGGIALVVSGRRSQKVQLLWIGVVIGASALVVIGFATYEVLIVLPCWAGGTCA